MYRLLIINASIVTPKGLIENGWIQIKGDSIEKISKENEKLPKIKGEIFNAKGLTIVPGFIDLQLNGGFGKDFTTNPESIWEVASKLPQYGVTSFLPTIISSPLENIEKAMEVVNRPAPNNFEGANVLGLHLEGPFLNPEKKGAHNESYFRSPSEMIHNSWHPNNGVRLVTIAPELEGSSKLIRQLVERGITVSAGHSNATYDQARNGISSGITMGTHLFNAMSPLNHRNPGLIGALLEDSNIKISIIADGIHVHPNLVSLIFNIKGSQNFILISDAMSALGMPPGEYPQIEDIVYVDEDSARLADGSLAGSILSMDAALRNMISYSGCLLEEIIPSLTSSAANSIGEIQRGELSTGSKADIVCLNKDLIPVVTMISGKVIWKSNLYLS